MIIAISGCSGSGKTTVVKSLIKELGKDNVCYLHQDSYYKDQGHIPYEEREKINYDHPEAIELNMFAQHLKLLKDRKIIEKPIYNYSTHNREKQTKKIKPKNIIIADGIHILNVEEIRKISTLKVFVDTDMDICFIRRLLRDTKERGRSVESVINQYIETVKPMQEKYVTPTIKYADFIIQDGGHNFKSIQQLAKLIQEKLNHND